MFVSFLISAEKEKIQLLIYAFIVVYHIYSSFNVLFVSSSSKCNMKFQIWTKSVDTKHKWDEHKQQNTDIWMVNGQPYKWIAIHPGFCSLGFVYEQHKMRMKKQTKYLEKHITTARMFWNWKRNKQISADITETRRFWSYSQANSNGSLPLTIFIFVHRKSVRKKNRLNRSSSQRMCIDLENVRSCIQRFIEISFKYMNRGKKTEENDLCFLCQVLFLGFSNSMRDIWIPSKAIFRNLLTAQNIKFFYSTKLEISKVEWSYF